MSHAEGGAFTIVPFRFIERVLPVVGPNGLAVYVALRSFAGANGEAFPSLPVLAKRAAIAQSTCKVAIAALERCGAVTVDRRKGAASLYRIVPLPEEPSRDAAATQPGDGLVERGTRPAGGLVDMQPGRVPAGSAPKPSRETAVLEVDPAGTRLPPSRETAATQPPDGYELDTTNYNQPTTENDDPPTPQGEAPVGSDDGAPDDTPETAATGAGEVGPSDEPGADPEAVPPRKPARTKQSAALDPWWAGGPKPNHRRDVFEAIWVAWRTVGSKSDDKGAARSVFRGLGAKIDDPDYLDRMGLAAQEYIAGRREEDGHNPERLHKFTKHLATWLNKRGWE